MRAQSALLAPAGADAAVEAPPPCSRDRERRQVTERILALLARGVGVSQILKQVPPRHATATQRLAVGLRLRGILWGALHTGHAPVGVKNTRRDLERTIAYLDVRLWKLVVHLAAGDGPANVLWPAVRPMAIDLHGAEIDVRDGAPSLTVLAHDAKETHDVCAVLLHMLGDRRPEVRVTVELPCGWRPTVRCMDSLRDTILQTHLLNQPVLEPPTAAVGHTAASTVELFDGRQHQAATRAPHLCLQRGRAST
jgi:hypothetical protein